MAYKEDIVVPSAARTVSGDSGILPDNYGEYNSLRCQLDITAASGTSPTLDVIIQDTLDGTNWNNIIAFTQAPTTGREVKNLSITSPFGRRLRVKWIIGGGSPSFTFSVIIAARNTDK